MKEEGVISVKSSQRRLEDERWNPEESLSARGLPWEPTVGANGVKVTWQFGYRDEEEVVQMPSIRQNIPRRTCIRKEDVGKE